LAWLRLAQGDSVASLAALDKSDAIARDNNQVTQLATNESQRAWLNLLAGQVSQANRWAANQTSPASDDLPFDGFRSALLLGLIWAQQTDTVQQAVDLLTEVIASAEQHAFFGVTVQAQILLALAYEALGKRETAVSHLQTAVNLAEPQGYIRLFANVGQPVITLLRQLPTTPYIQQILTAFSQLGQTSSQSPSPPLLVESLSPREQEVLALLGLGLSNREIAQKLFITVGTTKRHLSNIYGKLGVGSRTQALARVRELGLLEDK